MLPYYDMATFYYYATLSLFQILLITLSLRYAALPGCFRHYFSLFSLLPPFSLIIAADVFAADAYCRARYLYADVTRAVLRYARYAMR